VQQLIDEYHAATRPDYISWGTQEQWFPQDRDPHLPYRLAQAPPDWPLLRAQIRDLTNLSHTYMHSLLAWGHIYFSYETIYL
jgi:hypothetical protein